MLIRKETEYAILILLALAKKGNDDFYDVKKLAISHHLSETLLAKIFQKLAAVGIVESKFGPGGGFRLAKSPKKISLWNIFDAIQTPGVLKCYAGKAPYCSGPDCPLKNTVLKIEGYIKELLVNTTVFELINDKQEKNEGRKNK